MDDAVLVVGASGFIGGSLLRRLAEEDRPLRALVRSRAAAEAVAALGAEPFQGDLLDPASLTSALSGCGTVYHAAGVNTMCPRNPGRMMAVNVHGSVNLVEAAAAAGVGRVVYTSSAATLGEARGSVATAASPHRGWFLSQYERSKYLAERRVMELAAARRLDLVSVNPSSVQGPGRTSGTGHWLIRYANGRLHWLVETRVSLLAIEDCVTAHLRAAAQGQPGQRYLVSGATVPIRELIRLVAEVTGRSHRVRYLPPSVALLSASLVGSVCRVVGRRPPLCREMVRTLLHGHAYDGSQAAQELGFSYTPLPELVRSTLNWYVDQGLVADGGWEAR